MSSRLPALLALALAACGPGLPPAAGTAPVAPPAPAPPSHAPAPPVDPAPPRPSPAPPAPGTGGMEDGGVAIRPIGSWSRSPYQARERQVIRDAGTLAEVWTGLEAGQPPIVDFTREVVILAAAGERPTGGHEISVRRAAIENGRLVVEVLETSPGPNCMTTMALTQPAVLLALPATPAAGWDFLEREERRDCP
ncbi:MAG TPA: protease complex subunit PrcB family protein [Gemmatimonadales bacterium]|nr:protease complex subunit PrcB family protein [Gemmatimonadales bacterium]